MLDLTGVAVLDAHEFVALRQLLEMCAVMGARPVLCGLRAGVVAVLVDFGIDAGEIETAIDVESGLALIDESEAAAAAAEPAAPEEAADDSAESEEDPNVQETAGA